MKYLLIAFLIHCFFFNGNAQNSFEDSILRYREHVEKNLIQYLEKDLKPHDDSLLKAEIVITPLCTIHDLTFSDISENNIIHSLSIDRDTSIYKYELFFERKLYAIPLTKLKGQDYFSEITTYKDFIDSSFQLSMVKLAQKLSKTFFFLKVLPHFGEGCTPIAVIDHGMTKFIDNELNVYNNLEDLLLRYYGSIAKYLEINQEDSLRRLISSGLKTNYGCKLILRGNYRSYKWHVPTDTAKLMNMAIREIDSLASISVYQKKILVCHFKELLASSYLSDSSTLDVVRFEKAALRYIKETLTDTQYFKYLKGKERLSWLQNQAMVVLENYLYTEKKIPSDKITQELNKLIFDDDLTPK